eukprot:TRINITY_DN5295_c0_g1_i3.p6 TRINITY_DN5295_c0_g1~~TRINITY_DN5295_c0_g1_i3.p6  ORF type:complete len:114 (+),score=5.16 TRINITY_DN5295_c0_g1_i3:2329-2670(+)
MAGPVGERTDTPGELAVEDRSRNSGAMDLTPCVPSAGGSVGPGASSGASSVARAAASSALLNGSAVPGSGTSMRVGEIPEAKRSAGKGVGGSLWKVPTFLGLKARRASRKVHA